MLPATLLKILLQIPVSGGNWLTRLLACVGLALIVSCSAIQLGYNNADVAINWTARQYFDLEGDQEADFRARLAHFRAWHRNEELPRYEAFFHSAGGRVADGLSAEDIAWATSTVRERYYQLLNQAAVEIAPVLTTLTPAQLDHLQKQFAENNAKFAKENQIGNPDKRRKDRLARMRDNIKEWLGDLTPNQEARVAAMVGASPSLAGYRLEERRRLQARFVQILREHHGTKALAEHLRELVNTIETERSPEYASAIKQYEASLDHLLLDLDASLSPEQRKHVVQKFASLASDFKTLAVKENSPKAVPVKTAG
jgi:hypothetical protein